MAPLRPIAPILILSFTLASPYAAGAAEAKRSPAAAGIVVICDEDYPPYSFRDARGRLVGVIPDQWDAWAKATGVPAKVVGKPRAEAERSFASGEGDVLDAAFKTSDNERIYDFTPPYASIEVPIFIHSSISGIESPADLRSFRVAAKDGDYAADKLKALGVFYVERYPDNPSVAAAARRLDVRIFAMDKPPALFYLFKLGIGRDFHVAFELKGEGLRRGVRKGAGELLSKVEWGFAAIPAYEYDRINRSWLGTAPPPPRDVRLLWTIAGALAALVLALAFVAWMLKRRVERATEELRKKVALLERSEAKNRAFISALPDLCFVMDRDGRYLDYTAPDPALLALPPEAFMGKTMEEAGFPRATVEEAKSAIASVLDAGRTRQIKYSLQVGGATKDYECRIVPLLRDEVIAIARDVTDVRMQSERLARSLAEKDALLKEIHHRVKNNLQLVSSLLALQAQSYRDEGDKRLIVEAQQRIHSLARLHELAYSSPDLASIGLAEYFESLARGLSMGYGAAAIGVAGPRGLRASVADAVPLGLVANELFTNALKYGRGRIAAAVEFEEGMLRFSVEDEGPGLPPGLDPQTSSSMGFLLLRSLASQLQGSIAFSGPPGLRATLTCPFGNPESADEDFDSIGDPST